MRWSEARRHDEATKTKTTTYLKILRPQWVKKRAEMQVWVVRVEVAVIGAR